MRAKSIGTKSLLSVALIAVAGCDTPPGGQGIHGNILATPVKSFVDYSDLKIVSVSPIEAIEFTPVEVRYSWTPKVVGIVGSAPAPAAVRICPRIIHEPETSCVDIANPVLGRTYTGTIRVPAPPAGIDAPFDIVVVRQPDVSPGGEFYNMVEAAHATGRMTSAAKFDIEIDSFEVQSTRSTRTDTVKATLIGEVKSNPPHPSSMKDAACNYQGYVWCTSLIPQGDVQDGWHKATGTRIGPFVLVPTREDDLRFQFQLWNLGESHWQEVGYKVAEGFSMAGRVILDASGGGGATSQGSGAQIQGAMTQLHGAMFAGCDGELAIGERILPNKPLQLSGETLDAMTRGKEYIEGVEGPFISDDGNIICGVDGKYNVKWRVYRTSWRNWPPSF